MMIEEASILYNRVGKCPYCELGIIGSDVLRQVRHYQGPCVAMISLPHANYDLAARAYFKPAWN